jgi:DNA-binding MarR family transcriptional regulator
MGAASGHLPGKFDAEYLYIEILSNGYLDVKTFLAQTPARMKKDHVDRFLDELPPLSGLDLEVEGIVDRINGISRRVKRTLEATLSEFGISHGEWHVLSRLRLSGEPFCSSPGELAADLELSSGAMTNRLDRLQESGLVRRRPDPRDRRAIQVELTDEGRRLYEESVSAQARKEALIAGALSPSEQKRLNALLRKIMLSLEEGEGKKPKG